MRESREKQLDPKQKIATDVKTKIDKVNPPKKASLADVGLVAVALYAGIQIANHFYPNSIEHSFTPIPISATHNPEGNDQIQLEDTNSERSSEIDFEATSEVIDGIKVIGHKEAIDQQNIDGLIKALNETFNSGDMQKGNYYMTLYVSKSQYEQFKGKTDEEFITFIKRHEEELSKILFTANQKIHGVITRRIIVVQDGVALPSSQTEDYVVRGIKDSDGIFGIPDYDPRTSGYYDEAKRIDFGFLHELGHQILHLPDTYRVDYIHDESLYQDGRNPLSDIPEAWRSYENYYRNDQLDGLMADSKTRQSGWGVRLDEEESFILSNRLKGDPHDLTSVIPEVSGFRDILPGNVTISLGQENANGSFELYRSSPIKNSNGEAKKMLLLKQSGVLDGSGVMNINNPFADAERVTKFSSNETYPDTVGLDSSTLFIKVRKTDGTTAFRWLDITDFQIPIYRGITEKDGSVAMTLKLVTSEPDLNSFDWTIEYK